MKETLIHVHRCHVLRDKYSCLIKWAMRTLKPNGCRVYAACTNMGMQDHQFTGIDTTVLFFSIIMPRKSQSPKKKRSNCKYSAEERAIIEPFKEEYRRNVIKKQRAEIFHKKICTALVEYWQAKGQDVPTSRTEVSNKTC